VRKIFDRDSGEKEWQHADWKNREEPQVNRLRQKSEAASRK